MTIIPFPGRHRGARSTNEDEPLSRETFLWTLGSLCRLHRKPFDARLVLQQFPPPHSFARLRHAAEALGLEIERLAEPPNRLPAHRLPCIAWLCEDPEPGVDAVEGQQGAPEPSPDGLNEPKRDGAEPEPDQRLVLIVRNDDSGLIYFHAGEDTRRTVAADEAGGLFEPVAFSVRVQEEAAPADEADAKPRKFGFRWFVPELLRYKRVWRDILIASLFIQLLGLSMPLFTQVIIDKVIVHQTTSTLLVIATALVMFVVFTGVMTWVRQYLVLHTGNRVDAVLGARVFSHLFRLPLRYFEHRPTGTLVARLEGVETIRNFVTGAAVTLLLDLPFLVVFLAVMFFYSWQLTLIVLGILTAIGTMSLLIAPALRRRLNEQFQLGARNQAFLTEYISGAETVKSLQMEPQMRERYGDYLSSYLNAGFRTRRMFNTYNVFANTLEQVQMLTVLCVGAWIVMTTNTLTVGMLVAFNMFASRLAQPVMRIVGLWQEFQQASVAVRRLGDVMDAPAEPYSLLPSRTAGGEGRIEIQGLAFRYAEDRPFLYEALDLTVEPGTAIAITGPSGCGKSTLAKLLQGFYQPGDGQILIDGRDIRQLAANELRTYFGVVPQETQLFSGTIYDNLLIANPQAGFEQIVNTCRAAEIHETVEALSEGYQTKIGEHGAGLSGGQKQRLAIARALLKRPRILIFDEATSGLDAETAARFARTVNQFKGKVTLLFITHQLPQGLAIDRRLDLGELTASTATHRDSSRSDSERTPASMEVEPS